MASEATIERKVTVDDRYGGQHQLTQKVYDQGEDFYTFVRDGRPQKLVDIHENICQSVGGKDVFEKTTIMASDAVQDVTVCEITDPKEMAKIARENPGTRVSAGKHRRCYYNRSLLAARLKPDSAQSRRSGEHQLPT